MHKCKCRLSDFRLYWPFGTHHTTFCTQTTWFIFWWLPKWYTLTFKCASCNKKRNEITFLHYYWCFCEVMFVSYMWRFLLIYISGTSSRSSIWNYTLLVILFYKVMPNLGWVWSTGAVCITGDGYHVDALGINPLEAHAVSSEGCFFLDFEYFLQIY